MSRLLSLTLAALLGSAMAQPAAADSLSYTAIDLGTLNGYGTIYATGINSSGQVTGYAYAPGDAYAHAFVTGPNGTGMTDLGTLGGRNAFGNGISMANGINDAGQVTGYSLAGPDTFHAFVTGPNGQGMRDIGTLGGVGNMGVGFSTGSAINNTGQITGHSYTPIHSDVTGDAARHAFITGPNGVGMVDIGTLGGVDSVGIAINNAGRVTGTSYIEGISALRAFITGPNGVGMINLGTLGSHSYGIGINDAGQVVGNSYLADNYTSHAFITGPNGQGMIDLGSLGGDTSDATDINNAGQAVGSSYTAGNTARHAFVTGLDGVGMVDLNALVDLPGNTYLEMARGINDQGQVIADGSDGHAYLLSPVAVPEPETGALLLTGLGLMGFTARRRKNGLPQAAVTAQVSRGN